MIAAPGETTSGIVGFAIGLNFRRRADAEHPVLLSLFPDMECRSVLQLDVAAIASRGDLRSTRLGLDLDGLKSSLGTAIAYHAAGLNVALMFRDRCGHSARACLIDRCGAVV